MNNQQKFEKNIRKHPVFSLTISIMTIAIIMLISASSCFFFENKRAASIVKIHSNDSVSQGIILDKTGYLVTNAEAVKDSETISIELKSGTNYEGKIVCLKKGKDIAIIRMQGNFPVMEPVILADSDLVHQYDEVSVEGYQAGSTDFFNNKGTIVALPKSDDISYIQTNAALDPGTAGSVVVNKAGEAIGMVSWNAGHVGRDGYSLPINEIQSALADAQAAEANPLAIASFDPPSVFADRAIISWKTNRPSTSQVEFGLQTSYGNSSAVDETFLESHAVVIQNLQSKMLYHFRVRSVDGCGNETVSKDYNFTTVAEGQATALTIVNANVYDITSSAVSISWVTSKPSTTSVTYTQDKEGTSEISADSTPVYDHKVRLTGLNAETRYSLSIKSETEWDEIVQQDLNQFTTLPTAPVGTKINYGMPNFHFKTMQDTDFTNADIEGKKVFIIFTKTTCPTCMKQALFLNDIYKEWPKGDNLLMFMVASSEKKKDVEEWIKKYGLTVPVYLDANADLVNTFKFKTIPSTLFLDTGSVIRDMKNGGYGDSKTMKQAIKELTGQ